MAEWFKAMLFPPLWLRRVLQRRSGGEKHCTGNRTGGLSAILQALVRRKCADESLSLRQPCGGPLSLVRIQHQTFWVPSGGMAERFKANDFPPLRLRRVRQRSSGGERSWNAKSTAHFRRSSKTDCDRYSRKMICRP